jgi:preprotein translocase subunit SecG
LAPYINVVQIIVSVALIIVVLLQAKGTGFSGALTTEASIFSSRRGLEKTLFNVTIVLAAIFVIVSVLSVIVAKSVPVQG